MLFKIKNFIYMKTTPFNKKKKKKK